jgi:DnaJ-class molecular chaperone
MSDPYKTLGVSKNITEDELKKAYRKLAMEHHPDKGGDASKFSNINSAYETLKDPQKRAAYDQYGTDDPQQQGAQRHSGFQQQGFDFDSIFNIFGQRMGGQQARGPQRPVDARMSITISLADAVAGGKKIFAVQTHTGPHSIEINIPKGVVDNEHIRYPKLGPGGLDLVMTFRVLGHTAWHRDGLDMHCQQSVDFWQLILGCTLPITDILGRTYGLTVPAKTNPDSVMRLRTKGIEREGHNTGDLFVKLKATLPSDIPDDIVQILKKHQK